MFIAFASTISFLGIYKNNAPILVSFNKQTSA